jgi:hypothetical protein
MTGPDVTTPGAVGADTRAQKAKFISSDDIIGDSSDILKGLLLARARRAHIPVYETCSGGYALTLPQLCQEVPDLRGLQVCLNRLGVAP